MKSNRKIYLELKKKYEELNNQLSAQEKAILISLDINKSSSSTIQSPNASNINSWHFSGGISLASSNLKFCDFSEL